jgi:hypothetical protein
MLTWPSSRSKTSPVLTMSPGRTWLCFVITSPHQQQVEKQGAIVATRTAPDLPSIILTTPQGKLFRPPWSPRFTISHGRWSEYLSPNLILAMPLNYSPQCSRQTTGSQLTHHTDLPSRHCSTSLTKHHSNVPDISVENDDVVLSFPSVSRVAHGRVKHSPTVSESPTSPVSMVILTISRFGDRLRVMETLGITLMSVRELPVMHRQIYCPCILPDCLLLLQ